MKIFKDWLDEEASAMAAYLYELDEDGFPPMSCIWEDIPMSCIWEDILKAMRDRQEKEIEDGR